MRLKREKGTSTVLTARHGGERILHESKQNWGRARNFAENVLWFFIYFESVYILSFFLLELTRRTFKSKIFVQFLLTLSHKKRSVKCSKLSFPSPRKNRRCLRSFSNQTYMSIHSLISIMAWESNETASLVLKVNQPSTHNIIYNLHHNQYMRRQNHLDWILPTSLFTCASIVVLSLRN
jgi:hypothetical protein